MLELAGLLRPEGWELRKSTQSLYRKFPDRTDALHIAFVAHPDDFDFSLDVAIRFEAVEALRNRDRSDLSKKDAARTFSLGAELGNLAGTGNARWTIRSAPDVPRVARASLQLFRQVGLPFLERFSSLEEVDRVLHANGAEAELLAPIPQVRRQLSRAVSRVLR